MFVLPDVALLSRHNQTQTGGGELVLSTGIERTACSRCLASVDDFDPFHFTGLKLLSGKLHVLLQMTPPVGFSLQLQALFTGLSCAIGFSVLSRVWRGERLAGMSVILSNLDNLRG